jgi:hypothetical protein
MEIVVECRKIYNSKLLGTLLANRVYNLPVKMYCITCLVRRCYSSDQTLYVNVCVYVALSTFLRRRLSVLAPAIYLRSGELEKRVFWLQL